jgi:hypothetical protein
MIDQLGSHKMLHLSNEWYDIPIAMQATNTNLAAAVRGASEDKSNQWPL